MSSTSNFYPILIATLFIFQGMFNFFFAVQLGKLQHVPVEWEQWKDYADKRYFVVTNRPGTNGGSTRTLDAGPATGRSVGFGTNQSELDKRIWTFDYASIPAHYTTLIYERGREKIEWQIGNCMATLYHFTDAEWEILKQSYPNHLAPAKYRTTFMSTNDWSRDHKVSEAWHTNQPDAWPLDLPVSGK